jgi:uncharacterized RDD family membrane protein YckC
LSRKDFFERSDVLEDRLDIGTPEGVVFGYEIAGIGSRFIAALVDSTILFVLQMAFFCVLWAFIMPSSVGNWVAALVLLFVFVLNWGYFIFFEMISNGQTPGKSWIGLRVIRTDGLPVTLFDSLIRNLVRLIDFLPMYYIVGLITMFMSEQTRRLGDYAAGTLVVRVQRNITLDHVPQVSNTSPALPDSKDTWSLNESEYRLITDFMNRRDELLESRRKDLATRIATRVTNRIGAAAPASPQAAEELLVRWTQRPRQ